METISLLLNVCNYLTSKVINLNITGNIISLNYFIIAIESYQFLGVDYGKLN